jgi:tRNA(adenine34) deaminase
MLALRAGASVSGNYRLEDCTLYVTLEPCAMCSGAILHARLKRLVFAAPDPKTGCAGSVLNLFSEARLNHQTTVESGVLGEQAGALLQDFFRHKREQQRALAVPLREDALRTPERCFALLPGYVWKPHYLSDLAQLAGLRMHYVDEGPRDSERVYLGLHPVPGWGYSYRDQVVGWLGQGARVVLPDLIGFGRSDKPKREDFHSPAFHIHAMLALLERLDLKGVVLVSPEHKQWLAQGLLALAPGRIQGNLVLSVEFSTDAAQWAAHEAPFPDAGHRAAERAFAALGLS